MKDAIFFAFFLFFHAPLLAHECDFKKPFLAGENAIRRQNMIAQKYDLPYMNDQEMIESFKKKGFLVEISGSAKKYYLDFNLPSNRRAAAVFVKDFLDYISGGYFKEFKVALKITSLVRHFGTQEYLFRRGYSIARGHESVFASSHLTGATLDVSMSSMSEAQKRWIRRMLCRLTALKAVDGWEEIKLNHFHIMVYPDFLKKISQN